MYDPEIAAQICERITRGETLRGICRSDPKLPAPSTFLAWVEKDESLRERYARARSFGIDAIAEEIVEIADDSANDYIETEDGPKLNSEHVQRSRLRVDARKWLLSKLRPDKYGEASSLTVQGPNGGPVQSKLEIVFVKPAKSPDEA